MRGVALVFVACILGAACRKAAVEQAPARDQAAQAPVPAPTAPAQPAPPAGPPSLPEDPVAAKQAEQQWREHMVEEEHERQIGFDHRHLREHRALVKVITAARARFDRARTAAAVAKVRADMPSQVAEMRRRVTEIDRWGVNSRLLPDYAAVEAALLGPYADAKIAAIQGDPQPLSQVRAEVDQRMKTIADWLEQAAEDEGE